MNNNQLKSHTNFITMRRQISLVSSYSKNIPSSQSFHFPEKISLIRMTQILTLFFLVFLGGDGKQFVQADCKSIVCPMHERDNDIYQCNNGVKNYDEIFPDVNTGEISGEQCTYGGDCAYCDCNEGYVGHDMMGYTGLRCETKFKKCRDGNVCFHGAPCHETKNGIDICACHLIDSPKTFLGEHCEYEATGICTANLQDLFGTADFCTNNGKCRDGIGKHFEKCECDEGFYGLHCELTYEPSCDLNCKNGGVCSRGVKNHYSQQESASHCICPKGWEGDECQYRDNCNCKNGSICHHYKNTSYCDCSTTTEDIDGVKVLYAGLLCDSKVTANCQGKDGQPESKYFCTNGGRCPTFPHLPCDCINGFSGPKCEFKGAETKECTLQCANGGTCFFGNRPDVDADYDISEMHCKCPIGWSGPQCDVPFDICGAGMHHCLNNGECVKDGDDYKDYKCDCDNAIADTSYAGEHCEHPATSFCLGPGANKNSFCTNHGTCKELVYEDLSVHPGCKCNDPFNGEFCEKGATLEKTYEMPCLGDGDFVCYNHGSCKELVYEDLSIHPGCKCDSPYFGDLCEFKGNSKTFKNDNKAYKAFLGFTISLFGLVVIFFLVVVFRKKTDTSRNMGHTPVGVPTEVHLQALDLDHANDNTEIMGTGYNDDMEEVMENVLIN